MVKESSLYPDYTAEIEEIEANGITEDLLKRIIQKHSLNRQRSMDLYGRYKTLQEKLPIAGRIPRFNDNDNKEINNKLNNDFFGEIIDRKVGYFAGKPILYKYGDDSNSAEETGGEDAVKKAKRELKEFVKRNNMYDLDMETTKLAAICGYAGRLFYIDEEGGERVMAVKPEETILLYRTEMTEPLYAVRYYAYNDLSDVETAKAEFYDQVNVTYFSGTLNRLTATGETKPHLYDFCPLQGIPNNRELIGDVEKVIALIDDYDKNFSDNSNDLESFANAYMVYENMRPDEETMELMDKSGAIAFESVNPEAPSKVYFLTKNLDGGFSNQHLDREEDNIYRFSNTPNLNDPEFTASSGIALKIKMQGLETKCGMFEAKHQSASTYMFKLLASSFVKKGISFDPMQCSCKYRRNFPVDYLGDAQATQALIASGLPKQVAFDALSFIDDMDYVLNLIEDEKDGIPDLGDWGDDDGDDETENVFGSAVDSGSENLGAQDKGSGRRN